MSIGRWRVERDAFHTLLRQPCVVIATVIGFAVPRLADAQSGGNRLQLGDLIVQVGQVNPRIGAAQSLAGAARARIPGARRPPDPEVQLGFMNYTLPSLAPMAAVGMSQLQITQSLPLRGKLSLGERYATLQASAADARAQDVAWEIRSAAANAFYDLYATDRALVVARETLRLMQDVERIAEAMYRVGDGRQTDVLRAQVEIARMAQDTMRMQAMRTTVVARINALLDRDAELQVGVAELPSFPDTIPTQSWLDSVAHSGRSMILAGIDQVRGAEAAERLARKEIWPDLQIGVQYGQRGGEMGTERMGSLMLGASIPVFARDRQLRMRDEAAAMRQMAQADLAAMRAETRGRIGEALATLTRARTLDQLYRTTILPQAEATVNSALAAYRVGTVDFMTLLDDRRMVNSYRQELYALEAEQGKAWAELEMLTGRALMDLNRPRAATAGTRGSR